MARTCTPIPTILDNPDPDDIILSDFAYRMARFRRGGSCAPRCTPIILLDNPSFNQLTLWQCLILGAPACFLDNPTINEIALAEFPIPAPPPGALPAPTNCVTDDFERATGDSLGANWDETNENNASSFGISGVAPNRRISTRTDDTDVDANDQYGYVFWDAAFNDDQSAEAELFNILDNDHVTMAGLGVRMSGTKNNFNGYIAVIEVETNGGTKFLRLHKAVSHDMDNGSGLTQLATTTMAAAGLQENNGDVLKLTVVGSDLEVKVNDIVVLTATDTTHTGGDVGFVALNNQSLTIRTDNSISWDNWIGCGKT